jgi:threonine/homoserine/homoserine lactone efflux protein
MHELLPLLAILGALLVGAASPGPSFVLVARTSIALSRRHGLAAALGMGAGGVVFGGLALLGLQALLAQVEWLYATLRVAGGLYLMLIAWRLWRAAGQPLEAAPALGTSAARTGRSFWLALTTQLGNPKAAIAYASIFAALLPSAPPLWMVLALPPLIFLVEAGWYTLVALAFSAGRPRALYLGSKRWIDRTAGVVMGALGLRLVAEALRRP